jgi:AsmA family protein
VPVATDDHTVSHYSEPERENALARAWGKLRGHVARHRWSWPAFFGWAFALLIALVAGAVAYVYFLDWNTMRGPVGRYVSQRLGREVRIEGDLKVHLFSRTPSLSAGHVRIVNPVWAKGGLAADVGRYQMTVKLWPLLSGRTVITDLELDDPNIVVLRDAQGRTNWDGIGGDGDGTKLPPIQRFVVRNGHLAIDDRVRRMTFQGSFASHEQAGNEQAGAGDRAFALTGEGLLNSNKFLADVHGGPLVNVDVSRPYHFTADLRSGTTHAAIDGTLPKPFHLGQFQAKTEFSGPTMSDLYYLTGLVFPVTSPYHLSGYLTRDGKIYRLTGLNGIVGGSDMRGEMTVDAGQTPTFLRAKLSSRTLRLTDLGPLIGAAPAGHAKPGLPAPKSPALAKAVAGPLALPDTPLDVHRVRQMNADVDYSAASVKSEDFPLRDFHMHLALNNGVMTLDPLTFDFIRGKLSGSVKVDARRDVPVSDVDARLTDIRLEQFVKGNPPPLEGLLEARAKLHAVGNSIHNAASNADGAVTLVVPSGKLRKSFAELTGIDVVNGVGLLLTNDKSDTGVRCAVARFDARGGGLTAEQLTLDTDAVLIQGKGTADMRNETVNFEVTGQPKQFRIGRIRAPITISGPMAAPHVGIKAGAALGQGGIAAALGLVNPLASILAFVDPGLAKDANCAALTSTAAKGAAPVKVPHKAAATRRH